MNASVARLAEVSTLLLLCGCVGLQPYRPDTDPSGCQFDGNNKPTTPCHHADKSDPNLVTDAIEEHADYTLGTVEFTDQGWFFGPKGHAQMLAVMGMLQKKADEGGDLTLVVFVHGWKHNARSADSNVVDFEQFLSRVKTEIPGRHLIGIYVGWRGLSVNVPEPIRSTTLLDRKQTAEHVAKGSVRELFARIHRFQEQFTAENKESPPRRTLVSILVGHSFGGLIVFNAESQLLLDHAVDPGQVLSTAASSQPYRRVEPYFDLTILVNPAFEASRYEALHEVAACRRFPDRQTPVFVSLTAENDTATGFWFHAYRWVVTRLEKYYQPKDVADQERSGRAGRQTHKELEEEANRRTLGYVERYRTHSLHLREDVPAKRDESYRTKFQCSNVCSPQSTAWNDRPAANPPREIPARDGKHTMVLVHEPRESCDPNNPFWVVSVDRDVMSGHDGFFQFPSRDESYFTDFVVSLINQKVKEQSHKQKAIVSDR